MIKQILDYLITIVVAAIIGVVISHYVFGFARVSGSSMSPSLVENDFLFVNKMVSEESIDYGDILNIENVESGKIIVKRVVGLPGDTVEIKDSQVFVNGVLEDGENLYSGMITEPYGVSKWVVPEGHIFVLGDFRVNSSDSRIYGPIDMDNIQGEVILRAFPLNRLGKP